MEYTKEIVTPMAAHKVVIKILVTGAEREQIDGAQFKHMEVKEGKEGREAVVKDVSLATLASKHELLRVSVISIDGDITECFARLQAMYEPDYAFVYEQVLAEQKKMMPSTSAE